MNELNKKAQAAEFIGIAVLVVALVIIMIFSRMETAGSLVSRMESTLKEFRIGSVTTTGSVIPYVTVNGVPIEELIGDYSCYGKEEVDYGNGKINITEELRKNFNSIYGENTWALLLKKDSEKNSFPLFLTSSIKKETGLPSFDSYIAYDFRFAKPCRLSKGKGILFVIAE